MSVETDTVKNSRVAVNDVTGDSILTKCSTEQYRDNWDRIFGNNKVEAIQTENISDE